MGKLASLTSAQAQQTGGLQPPDWWKIMELKLAPKNQPLTKHEKPLVFEDQADILDEIPPTDSGEEAKL